MSDNEPQTEAAVESTVSEATRSLDGASALAVAQMRHAEMAREGGPRTSLLHRINSAQQSSDDDMIASGQGLASNDLAYAADLLGVDIGIMRATFAYLGRNRVSEDELRAAVVHVGAREV